MAVTRPKSDQPAAVRQRRKRERDKLREIAAQVVELVGSNAVTPAPAAKASPLSAASTPAPAVTSHGLWTTSPEKGPGPDEFAVPAAGDGDGDKGTPFVEGDGAAAQPHVVTDADATMIASGVVAFYRFGVSQLLAKRAAAAAQLAGAVDLEVVLTRTSALVFGSAKRLCFKYNVSFRYADECVVAGALGLAGFGIAAEPDKSDKARAASAKNANVPRDTSRTSRAAERDTPQPDDDAPLSSSTTLGDDEEIRL